MRPFTAPTRAPAHAPEGMSLSGGQAPQRFAGMPAGRETNQAHDDAQHPDDYDDGLVHNHNWASETCGK